MDLTSLNFKVNTKELEDAFKTLQQLKGAVDGLSTPMQNLAKNSGKVSKAIDETEKATKRNTKAVEETADKANKAASILEKQVRTLSVFRNETQKVADGTVKLGDSFTKSQSGMLALMQMAGATASEMQQLAKTFTDYNKITGLNTFDKSAQAMSKLKKEISETNQVLRLQAQGINLTRDEFVGLARDLERTKQAMRAEGASAKETANAMRELKSRFIELAQVRNQQVSAAQESERLAKAAAKRMQQEVTMMDQAVVKFRQNELAKQKAAEKTAQVIEQAAKRAELAQKYLSEGFTIGQANRGARLESSGADEGLVRQILKQDQANREAARSARDYANAVQFLADEERKADAVLQELTGDINRQQGASERTATKVAAYGRALERSGVDAQTAAAKMELYKNKLHQIEKIETQRRSQILSRALAPQISDVVVSLGSGQNPLTVLLQQGLQVRDLIGQSGVAVEDLQRTFKTAAADMVSSLRGTAVAIGSLLIGTIADAGKAAVNFVTGPFKLLAESYTQLGTYLRTGAKDTDLLDASFKAWAQSAASVLSLLRVGLIGFAAALAVAGYQVMKEQTELSKALTLTGAGLGLSKNEALDFAKSMNDVGVSTSSSVKFLTELGKASAFIEGDLKKITKSATSLSKVAGVSLEDTAKRLQDLGEKPTDALIKYAKESGMVEISVLKQVAALEKSGEVTEAARIAQEAWAEGAAAQAATVYENLSPVEKVWVDIKSQIKGAWESMKDFARSEELAQLFAIAWQAISVTVSEVWYVIKSTAREIGGIGAQLGAFLRFDFDGIKRIREEMIYDAETAKKEQEELVKRLMSTGKATKEYNTETQKTSKELKENADAAAAFSRQLKEAEKAAKDAAKEAARLRKAELRDKERINDLTGESTRITEGYSKAQKLALDIFTSEDFGKYSETTRKEIAAMIERAHIMEKNLEYEELRAKVAEHSIKLTQESIEALTKENVSIAESNEALRNEIQLIGLTEDEIYAVNRAKEEKLILEKELAIVNAKNNEASEAEIALMETQLELLREGMRLRDQKRAAEQFVQYRKDLSDAIETALFEGGRAGSKKLRDVIVAELRKPIRVFIEAVVGNVIGGIFGGGSGGSSSGSVGGSLSQGMSLSSISSIFDVVKGGLNVASSGGQAIANLMAKTVSQFGASTFTNLTTQFASGMMSTGSLQAASQAFAGTGAQMAGVILGSVMNGFSGYGISKALSGGYSAGNGVNTIAGIASMIPGIGPIAGVVGGLVNRAFGRKAPVTTGSGITGTFSTSGADVLQYQDWFSKGGWFRSNKSGRNYSAVSSELDKFLDESLMQITATTKAYASILGLIPEAIDGVTQGITISLMGLSAEGQQQAIANALGGFSDRLAMNLLGTWETTTVQVPKTAAEMFWERLALGVYDSFGMGKEYMGIQRDYSMIDPYKTVTQTVWKPGQFIREGETAGQALARLATSLTTVNSVFDTLNKTLMQVSVVGGDAASKLIDAFGGTENFTKLTTDYYQNYYTEQERVATTTRQLTTIFGQMGLTLPKTREEFRALVDSQNLYTDAGRSTYAALLNLAPAFATITTAVEQFTSSLIDEVRRLRGEIAGSSAGGGLDYFKAQFSAANTAALAGDATALQQLPELSRMVEEAAKTQANSSADIVRIQAWLAQSLATTSGALGQQVPQFATGGMHSGGARIVGENGPELEITGPSRIMNASQTASILNGSTAELLQRLNDNISGLRAEVRADVTHNAKVAKLLDRVIPDGDAIAIRTAV